MITLLVACEFEDSKVVQEEIIELYGVSVIDEDYHANELKFKESYLFDSKGVEIAHHFFDISGQLDFKEIYSISEDGKLTGSKYYNSKDSLMSYYTHKLDSNGNKIETKAFDASNNELLRIEEFDYDEYGNISSKTTMTPDLKVVRKQVFLNDALGNELLVRIMNDSDEIIFEEEYRITEYNEDQKWTEKWGFINNSPNSYRKRIFNRY